MTSSASVSRRSRPNERPESNDRRTGAGRNEMRAGPSRALGSAGLRPVRGGMGRPFGRPPVGRRTLAMPTADARDRLGLVLVLGDDVLQRLVRRLGAGTWRAH